MRNRNKIVDSDCLYIMNWLIAQRDALNDWMEEVDAMTTHQNDQFLGKLEAHKNWLARSIENLKPQS